MKRLIFLLILMVSSTSMLAAEKYYQADVEGMVCAFCAYSVSRDVAELPGVNADSVDVDLENGKVTFSSSLPVSQEELVSIFSDTGFKISALRAADPGMPANSNEDFQLALELDISAENLPALESVLESVGDLAAEQPSRMVLSAPASQEEALLKPLLMGRRQVMNVRFNPGNDEDIQLQLFLARAGD